MARRPRFTVDTHVFKELGTLLVGRTSTALVELIKNSYDADAEKVTVYGHALDDAEHGYIRIEDNGTGMTLDEFENGFLRIASRSKETPERRSRLRKRRYTGAKGIGRLAAHKLAAKLQIASFAKDAKGQRHKVDATIDWDAVEKKTTLDELGDDELSLNSTLATGKATGTEITLQRLRQKWTPSERERFMAEVQTFEPPEPMLLPLHQGKYRILDKPLLFAAPRIRDTEEGDTFRVFLEGDFKEGDNYWARLTEAVEWVIEVDASAADNTVRYGIAPTRNLRKAIPSAQPRIYEAPHPAPGNGLSFQARILVREQNWTPLSQAKTWARHSAGIRVFMEGFRVLPYGEYRNDWLSIDADYTDRDRNMKLYGGELLNAEEQEWEKTHKVGLKLQSNEMFFGSVFLTENGAPDLKMLINREGFVPDPSFESMVKMLRTAIHLFVRVRAAARESVKPPTKGKRKGRPEKSPRSSEPRTSEPPESEPPVSQAVSHATRLAQEAQQALDAGKQEEAQEKLARASEELASVEPVLDELMHERVQTRLLASVGMQMTAFVHEIQGLMGLVQDVDTRLAQIAGDKSVNKPTRQRVLKVHSSVEELRRSLERHASYLVDIITPDARRRRSRQTLSEQFDSSLRWVRAAAEKRSITLKNDIPTNLKSSPMFQAELACVFGNLLSNAVKFAGTRGRVRATGKQIDDGNVRLVIENTGTAVDLADSERWFQPFESTTPQVDATLGQGMGMGLPITRNMLRERGAEIRFVKPSSGYATAIEVVFQL